MQLDPHRLLGFRLEAREVVSFDRNGLRIAAQRSADSISNPSAKIGQKTGGKTGGKIGGKIGGKVGRKFV